MKSGYPTVLSGLNDRISTVLLSVIFFTILDCQASAETTDVSRKVIVTCQWLEDNISDPDLVVLHISAIKRQYENGHIPGSRFLWPGWISVSDENESTIPADMKEIEKTLERLGVGEDSHIVLAGNGGNLVVVSRVYVTLCHYGLGDRVSILQGGSDEWKSLGRMLSVEQPVYKKGKLALKELDYLVDAEWMTANLSNKSLYIIDVRPKASYDGSTSTRLGHIPGAKNLQATELYDSKSWHFISEEKIKELFAGLEMPEK